MSDDADAIPSFPRRCRDHAADAWGASFEHPFVRALVDGSLDPDPGEVMDMGELLGRLDRWGQRHHEAA